MAEIQNLLSDEILNFVDSYIKKAKVIINGVEIEKEIYRTIKENGVIRKYVYLDHETGVITKAALVDSQGRELYVKSLNYTKGADGFTIVFPIKQTIEVMA